MAEQSRPFGDDATEKVGVVPEFGLPLHKIPSFLLIPECGSNGNVAVRAVSA